MLTITPEPQAGFFTVTNGRFTASIKAFDNPSDFGLLTGRISKIEIRDNEGDEVLFRYDRGFDVDDLDWEGRRFLAAVVNYFDGIRVPPQGESHA